MNEKYQYPTQPLNNTAKERFQNGARVVGGAAVLIILICTVVFLLTRVPKPDHKTQVNTEQR